MRGKHEGVALMIESSHINQEEVVNESHQIRGSRILVKDFAMNGDERLALLAFETSWMNGLKSMQRNSSFHKHRNNQCFKCKQPGGGQCTSNSKARCYKIWWMEC